ncbi:BTAD domain-containing putative transcriptional regulator [Streptosporangium sp. NPDC023615]|uniref:BTAD domain-containing putative transcriptional regulator n=1 Tax=Streptosporangium sp. NPDC023615 TaxID=3154794 RepID=UPI003433A0FE
MLGPLEAVDGDQRIALGGVKQRATLGFLLFHANRVVPTSQLMEALWPIEPPVTARKILQNAVWSLRGALCARPRPPETVALLTQSPGYMLRVDPDDIDLYRFNRWVSEGRAELAAGSPATAAARLREALSLWQGSALADLVEAGVDWPEITSAQNARLDATEDCFEAELACGRHQSVLGALEAMIQAEPLRERLCGQLMLALYRCGRQADALSVYGRVRAALVEDLGLEPGRELQILHQAILAQDAVLDLPDGWESPEPVTLTGPVASLAPRDPLPRQAPRETERSHVSVLLVRAQHDPGEHGRHGGPRPGLTERIKEVVTSLDGTTVVTIGQVTLALFGTSDDHGVDAGRAVRAAVEIRDTLGAGQGPAAPAVTVQAAVTTGEAVVHHHPATGALLSADGPVLDECQLLLSSVPPGEIRVCDDTMRATAATIGYSAAGDSPRCWKVKDAEPEPVVQAVPINSHELELSVLQGLLEQVRHRRAPHVVTLLGEAGTGKNRLVVEFERRVMGQPGKTQFLVGHAPLFGPNNALALLESVGGIMLGDLARTAGGRAARTLEQLMNGERKPAGGFLSLLNPLVGPQKDRSTQGIGDTLAAVLQFIGEIARNCPLVVIVEDLHRADDVVLDFVHDLADRTGPVSLLLIVTARPDLLNRRPGWGGGKRRFTTITMDPPVESAVSRREEFLRFTTQDDAIDSGNWLRGTLLRSMSS